ncbi:HNH endonuclease [Herbaspirillum sp. GCM10030257]|uniref:HNH endonuclease n=1 Tax=Herbaspirillum sp. GCM10030257 TaxID=3273393 RepID=UPI003623FCC9
MISPSGSVYIFYRKNDRDPFTFAGKANVKSVEPTVPVKIVWSFQGAVDQLLDFLADEVEDPTTYFEGATKTISVNVYERNPNARKACIKKYGCKCTVCGFDFEKKYGAIGEGFIHVHHLKQLADIGTEYELDPEVDLRPVCPNCHAMLHRRRPSFSIEELRSILKEASET